MAYYRKYAFISIILILPWLVFHWMLPFVSRIYPDQDFIMHYGLIQTEYLFSMKTGTFPLNIAWHQVHSNSWAGVAGIFNPVFYFSALLYVFTTGSLLDLNIFLLLIMLLITHLALFGFLKQLFDSNAIAFLLSVITVYSPRLLVCFSFGGAPAIWPGYLLLCVAIGYYCLKPSPLKGPLLIIGLSYWLISAGFVEEIYFSLLGVVLFTLFIPYLLSAVLPEKQITTNGVITFWIKVSVFCLIGALLAAAFIIPFLVDSFKEIGLSQKNYAVACTYSSTIPELMSNFFLPSRSSPSGLVGSSPLLLVVMLIPMLALCRFRIPRIVWVIWGFTCLVLLCMLGNHTPIHFYVWKFTPLYSVTRYANRISMILPVLFLLMLIWLFKNASSLVFPKKQYNFTALSILALPALCITLGYAFWMIEPAGTLSPSLTRINLDIIPGWIEPVLLISGLLILIITVAYGLKTTALVKPALGLTLCILACLQLIVFYRYAPLARKKLEARDFRTYEKFLTEKQQHTDLFLGKYIHGFEKVLYPDYAIKQWEQVGPQPLLAKIYKKYIIADDLAEAYKALAKGVKNDTLVVSGYRKDQSLHRGEPPVRPQKPDSVRLTYNSSNRFVFNARAGQPSFFMFSCFRNGHWQARVNGKAVPTYAADGMMHAVRVPAGTSTVEFRYRSSAAFAGMLISCLTLAGLAVFFGFVGIGGQTGFAIALAGLATACGIFGLWRHSLYSGDNLHTRYNWQAPAPNAPRNLAYGKPARASMPPFGSLRLNLIHGSRFAVDGGHAFASCFSSGNHRSPWLEIDLQYPQPIGSIVIYTDLQGLETENIAWFTRDSVKIAENYNFLVFEKNPVSFNLLPLTVSLSVNKMHWETAGLDQISRGKPLIVRPEKPVVARYIRIAASGTCRLCLNEVEIYPPLPEN